MKHTLMKLKEAFAVPLRNGLTKPSKVRGSGIPMVNMKEIFAYNKIYDDTPMELVPVTEKELENTSLEFGDLLFARQSLTEEGAGKVCIYKGHQTKVFESHLIRCRLDKSRFNSDYFYYFFSSSTGKALVSTIVQQTAAAGIRGSDLQELEIPVPPLPEQKAIASVLSSLDDKIDLLHRQNKTLEAMAETLFRQWFIEEAKEDWGEIPFGNLIELHDSKRVPLSQLQRDAKRVGTLYPYYGASGVIDQINGYIFDGNYLLLSEDGENLRTRKTPIAFEAHGKFWVNNHAHVMQAIKPFTNGFVRILLEGENLDSIITGAVQPKINQANLLSYKVPNFPHVLVEKYVDISEPWFNKVLSNNEQIQTLENLRDTLLPKLMSGEVRVHYQTEEVA